MKLSSLLFGISGAAAVKEASEKYVKLDFDKYYGVTFADAEKGKRVADVRLLKRADGFEEVQITNQNSFYSVTLEVGTPAQKIVVLVDTGSSDLWVTGSDNPYCASSSSFLRKRDDDGTTTIAPSSMNSEVHNEGLWDWLTGGGRATRTSTRSTPTATGSAGARATIDCSKYGTFDTSKSSTWSSNHTGFLIQYGDTTFASGTWGQDQLHLSDLNVTGLSFAVANQTNSTVGVLGIGLPALEVTYSGKNSASGTKPYQYANLPMVLVNSGAIHKNAYSLFLNNASAEYGSVLFGAVDHSKYSGPLVTVPMVNTYAASGFKNPIQFEITLSGLGITMDGSNTTITTTKIPALLDSGTTLTYFPEAIVDSIMNTVGATYSRSVGYYTFDCPANVNDFNIVFDFNGFQISASISDFVIGTNGQNCILGILPQSTGGAILGDSFLNSAYVVYDLENYQISLGQADYSGGSENIEVISDSVPSAVSAPDYSNTWSTLATTFNAAGDIFTNTFDYTSQTGSASGSNSQATATSGSTSASQTGSASTTRRSTSASATTTSSTSSRGEDQKKNDATKMVSSSIFVLISFVFFLV
ncbi:pepsin-like aspartic protease RNJ42_00704 [Nakaseomyces bracarensis]|uniref:pepsin-like aspartic protease n=1 Tax=Nakaseomyces bracarensis TaxID=273131 RepID=UPI0038723D16